MPENETPQTLYILDGSYYIFRAFHAIRELRNSSGFPTNGLFAFTNMLVSVIRDHRPTHLAVAFDPPGGSFRREIYPEYKANREAPPEELKQQLPFFRDIVQALSIPIIEIPRYEADDVIGSLVKHRGRDGLDVVILSGDKDLFQLIDDKTVMVDSMRGKRVDLAEVEERFQVGPELVASVLALAGDSSDNIPGAVGVGEKTAGSLLKEFGSIEGIYKNIDKVRGPKRRENLKAFEEQVPLSLELTTIKTDVPLDLDWSELALDNPDFDHFDELCRRFEFRRLPGQLRELFEELNGAADSAADSEPEYETIFSLEELDRALESIRRAGVMSIDLETTSLEPLDAQIVGIALAWEGGHAVYVPVAHVDLLSPEQLELEPVLERLKPMLEDPSLPKIAQNARYEIRVLGSYGIKLQGLANDPMIAAYLVNPNRRRYGLDALALDWFGHKMATFEEVAGKGKSQKRFDEVSVEVASHYGAEDADYTLRLAEVLSEEMKQVEQTQLFDEVELPLVSIIAGMESTGVLVDTDYLSELRAEFQGRISTLQDKVYEAAGEEFLLSSPAQLGKVLFEKLELPVKKRNKTGPSTDQAVLEELAPLHPMPQLVLEWRQLTKLQSTYVEALPKLVHAKTGRVHSSWQQTGTSTGRLSSAQPNLQNIPVRSDEGLRIRKAFITEPGWSLLSADYSQIELRLLAHMSREPMLIEAFQRGEDIHRRTASQVFEVEPEEVTRDQRDAAKTINFGVMYGMGANRLAKTLAISRAEASQFIDRYFDRLGGVRDFFDDQVARASQLGYASTLLGRRRAIPELGRSNNRDRALGERLAVNAPIQGSAADLIKVAMVRLNDRIIERGLSGRLLMQVHDELVLESPDSELPELRELLKVTMEGVMELAVPLVVDLEVGPNWAELKP